mgnify:CR=1 FL=1
MSNESDDAKKTQEEEAVAAAASQASKELEEAHAETAREKVRADGAVEVAESMKRALEVEREKSKKKSVKASEEDGSAPAPSASANSVVDIVDAKLNEFKKTLAIQERDRILKSLTLDEKEQQAILDHYDKRLIPSGFDSLSIEKDLRIARAAVHVDHLDFKPDTSGSANAAGAMSGGSGKPAGATGQVTDKHREIASMVGMDPDKYAKYSGVLEGLTNK